MRKNQILAFSLVFLFVLGILPSMQASANPNPSPPIEITTDPNTGKIFVKTETLTVKMNPTFPAFTFFYTPENEQGMIYYSGYSQIIEFNDTNGDGAFQRNETVKLISLPIFQWSISINEIKDENGTLEEIRVTYTKVGISREFMNHHPSLPINYSLDALNNFTLQFVAHIYTHPYDGTIVTNNETLNYTVTPKSEMKIDIIMSNFPFESDQNLLTLRVNLRTVTPKLARILHRIRMMNRNQLINISENWYKSGKMERIIKRLRNQTMSQIDLNNENTTTGFFKWINSAIISHPGGENELVNVTASYAPDGIGIRVFLTYPNFDGGTLIHDPSIGINQASETETPYSPIRNPTVLIAISIFSIVTLAIIVKKYK